MDSKSELNNRPPNLFLGILERERLGTQGLTNRMLIFGHLADDRSTRRLLHFFATTPCWRDPTTWSKQLSTIAILGFQFGLYHVVVVLLSFLRSNRPCFVVILLFLADQIFYRSYVHARFQTKTEYSRKWYRIKTQSVGRTLTHATNMRLYGKLKTSYIIPPWSPPTLCPQPLPNDAPPPPLLLQGRSRIFYRDHY